MYQYFFAIMASLIIGWIINSSIRVISEGDQALVERLGKYQRTLGPGLGFIIPLLENVAYVDTVRERFLDVKPQATITKDNVALEIDAVIYWQIKDLRKAYYGIDAIEDAISNLVLTTLRSEVGDLPMEEVLSGTTRLNRLLLSKLDDATSNWGVKVIRVEIQGVGLPQVVQQSMALERAAKSEKKALIEKAEAEKQAIIERAEGTAKSMKRLADALGVDAKSPEFLKFLIAQQYVDANHKLGESNNSKILFMDPKALTEALTNLMGDAEIPFSHHHHSPTPKPLIEPEVILENQPEKEARD